MNFAGSGPGTNPMMQAAMPLATFGDGPHSVASQNLNKQKSMEKRNTMRITQESKSPGKKHNFFDT